MPAKTVTQLTQEISTMLEGSRQFQSVLVQGELTGVSRYQRDGRLSLYFSLKDSQSLINAVMFDQIVRRVKFYPQDGMNVIVMGSIVVYKPRGVYQIRVTEMVQAGAGSESAALEQLKERLEKEFGVNLIKTANPDEAVSLGAAVQGGILAGENTDLLLLDVTPLNLGIETMGGVMTTVIEANTTIPAKKTQIFSTAVDNQPGVEISVLQGNRSMAKDNKQIGIFHLDGIAPAPAHVPQIEVTFDIDANGILSVSAKDKATEKEQHITIEAKGGLTDAEVERMKKEAEEFAEADKKAKEEVDKINAADSFAFQISKSIETFGDKVTEDEKKELEPLIESLKKAAADKKLDDIDAAQKALQEKWTPIAARIYQESAQQAQPETEATAEPEK